MYPVRVRLAAAGFTDWIFLDRLIPNFNVGIGVSCSSNANFTYSVQHTFDNLRRFQDCKISRTTTTATVTLVNHGLSVGDYINMQRSGSTVLDGAYSVASITDQNTFTYTVANSGATADNGSAQVTIARVRENIILTGIVATSAANDGDTNYTSPVTACRLYFSSYTAGYADMNVIQGVEGF